MDRKPNRSAWIAFGGTVLAAIIGLVGVIWNAQREKPKDDSVFSGVIKFPDGLPAPSASVQVTLGQETPQSTHSDDNGAFHVEVPQSIRSIHISIYKSGFKPVEVDANPHRTGPEIIYLTPAT